MHPFNIARVIAMTSKTGLPIEGEEGVVKVGELVFDTEKRIKEDPPKATVVGLDGRTREIPVRQLMIAEKPFGCPPFIPVRKPLGVKATDLVKVLKEEAQRRRIRNFGKLR